MAIATPLSVSGRWIIDANGNRVKLAGVSWAGAHQDAMTPGGLDYRQRGDIAAQIAESGFNSVRFPFALQTVTWGSPVASVGILGLRRGGLPLVAAGEEQRERLPPGRLQAGLIGFVQL